MTWTDLKTRLDDAGYVASDELAMAIHIALQLERPILLEGDAGVGKTQIAKTLAEIEGTELIRLQCYEGLDAAASIYEWNYQRQLLSIRASADSGTSTGDIENRIFSREFLLERPLLRAIQQERPPVLLIDELDRADEAFEAYLLEILSEWQVTIPEFGTVAAKTPPIVIVTSNRTREIHDALKRRCFYHWVDYPTVEDELDILRRKAPEAGAALGEQVVRFVQRLRGANLFKAPGVAETIDWAQALVELDCVAIDPAQADSTMGVLLKYQDDIARISGSEAARILTEVQTEMSGYKAG
jgi:MoxR-like ATPase